MCAFIAGTHERRMRKNPVNAFACKAWRTEAVTTHKAS
jgi:hypothetical protein